MESMKGNILAYGCHCPYVFVEYLKLCIVQTIDINVLFFVGSYLVAPTR